MARETIILNPGNFSNPATFADGSSAAPSITFASDTTKGLYSQGANSLGFTVQGAAQWFMTTATLSPATDNTDTLGDSTHRASSIHTAGITIGQSLANPTMGVVTLSGSGVAIAYTSAFTAGARVFLTHQNAAGTTGTARVTASTVGVGFTITSSSATDTSTIGWWVVPVS